MMNGSLVQHVHVIMYLHVHVHVITCTYLHVHVHVITCMHLHVRVHVHVALLYYMYLCCKWLPPFSKYLTCLGWVFSGVSNIFLGGGYTTEEDFSVTKLDISPLLLIDDIIAHKSWNWDWLLLSCNRNNNIHLIRAGNKPTISGEQFCHQCSP